MLLSEIDLIAVLASQRFRTPANWFFWLRLGKVAVDRFVLPFSNRFRWSRPSETIFQTKKLNPKEFGMQKQATSFVFLHWFFSFFLKF